MAPTRRPARLAEVMETLHRDPPEDAASHARLLAFRARWLRQSGRPVAAQATAARAVARVRDQPDPELRSDVFREVGLLSFRLELPGALGPPTQAVDCVRDQPRSLRLASALSARGGIRINQGAYPAAEADLSEAIHRFEELGEAASAARCRGRIATLRKLAGRFSEAQALFDRARAAMPDDAPAYDQANLRMNHGNLLADLGQLDAATAAYQAAIEIGAAGGEDAMVASVQGSLATVLAEQRRDDEARAAFSEALRVHRLNGSRTQVAYCTLGLAELCMDTEDLATAGDLLDDIEATIASLSSPQLTVAHGLTRSVWLSRMGQPAAALEAARRCGALMEAHRVRRQQTGLLFALGLAAASGVRSRTPRPRPPPSARSWSGSGDWTVLRAVAAPRRAGVPLGDPRRAARHAKTVSHRLTAPQPGRRASTFSMSGASRSVTRLITSPSAQPGRSDPLLVQVVGDLSGQVDVDDPLDPSDTEATAAQVGGDEGVDLAGPEGLEVGPPLDAVHLAPVQDVGDAIAISQRASRSHCSRVLAKRWCPLRGPRPAPPAAGCGGRHARRPGRPP